MDRFEILKDIGSGNFGVAKLVRDKWSGELYAVKYIQRGQKVLYVPSFLWILIWVGVLFYVLAFAHWFEFLFLGFWQIDEHVQREIMNHRALKHPNIIRFKEVSKQVSLIPKWHYLLLHALFALCVYTYSLSSMFNNRYWRVVLLYPPQNRTLSENRSVFPSLSFFFF